MKELLLYVSMICSANKYRQKLRSFRVGRKSLAAPSNFTVDHNHLKCCIRGHEGCHGEIRTWLPENGISEQTE